MKFTIFALITLTTISAYAGIVESTVAVVESSYNLKCGKARELKQDPFKPIRQREAIDCANNAGEVEVVIQTEAMAKGQPLYKVQILAANEDFEL